MSAAPRVGFMIRYPAGDGKWWFRPVYLPAPADSSMPMAYPPAPGDLISLYDDRDGENHQPEGGPVFRVVARMWNHAAYGSGSWPYGRPEPVEGPLLDIIAEPAPGLYADETSHCGDGSCDAVMMNGAWWLPPGSVEPDPHEHRPYTRGPS